MTTLIDNQRPRCPSIFSVFSPIEEYWNSYAPRTGERAAPATVLEPLDAHLVHLIVDLHEGAPVLIDLASLATAGASSVIGLTHDRLHTVIAACNKEIAQALQHYRQDRMTQCARLEMMWPTDVVHELPAHRGVLILAHANSNDPAQLPQILNRWLNAYPHAIILILGLGRIGECGALTAVLQECAFKSGRRFSLLRELADSLNGSSLGVLSRSDNSEIRTIFNRLRLLYTGNMSYLDLLKTFNQTILETVPPDMEGLKSHPASWPWTAELSEAQRKTREAREQLKTAQQELARVHDSLGYRLALRLERMRTWMLPVNTRRYAYYQQAVRIVKRLRPKEQS